MNKNAKKGILVLILLLAIGFAAVTTNLIINGNAQLGFSSSSFDIYFSSAVPEEGGTATIDQTTRKTITYSTKQLKNIGDEAVLDYVVTNNSTQYDANGTITFNLENGADEYVTIVKTGFTDNQASVVPAKSSRAGRIRITLKKRSLEPIDFDFTLTINFEPVGREGQSDGEGGISNPVDPNCVSDGWYVLQCSCDNHAIAWLDGPYLDAQGNAMNGTRAQELTYPPANTYICGCENGTTGYVVNTGEIQGTICGVTNVSHDNLVTKLMAKGDDMPQTYGYDVDYSVTVNNTVGGNPVAVTLDDWKLLYVDGTYAYLITSTYAPSAIVVGETARYNLDADQDLPPTWGGLPDTNGSQYYVDGSKVAYDLDNENRTYKLSAPTVYNTLNDNSNWTQLLNDKSDLAWGGAPKEYYFNSWNTKYPDSQLTDAMFTNSTDVTNPIASDTLYFNGATEVCSIYYLDAKNDDYVYRMYYSYDPRFNYWPSPDLDKFGGGNCLRPVIRLKADVDGTIDDEHHSITLI